MKYFEPRYSLKASSRFGDKLGGRPQGLGRRYWPSCTDCGKPQTFLAQLIHHPNRLNLGRTGRVLYIFQCSHEPGTCETWDHSSGANACVIVEPEDLILPKNSGHRMPSDINSATARKTHKRIWKVPKGLPPLGNEVFICEWKEKEDGVEAQDYSKFFSGDTYYGLPVSLTKDLTWATRLGGVPTWIQSGDEHPKPGWRFLGQLSENFDFYEKVKRPPKWIYADEKNLNARFHYGTGPNFGGGIAYLFLQSRAKALPTVKMFWQC